MRMMMAVLFGVLFTLNASTADIVWACSSAGKNVHVGVITQVNAADRLFTITDAETGEAMVFLSEPTLVQPLNIGDRVAVSYEEQDGKMIAKRIT